MNKPRVYDTFSFFQEVELLHLRLAELSSHVHRFLIVEANRTFSGNKRMFQLKDLFEKDSRFIPFQKKVYIFQYETPTSFSEQMQKNSVWGFLKRTLRENDILHFSDLDEIPIESHFSHVLSRIPEKGHLVFHGRFHCYSSQKIRLQKTGIPCYWHGGVIGKWKWIFNTYNKNGYLVKWRDSRSKTGIPVFSSSVHFSYMGTKRQIIEKLTQWGHSKETRVVKFLSNIDENLNTNQYIDKDCVVKLISQSTPTIPFPHKINIYRSYESDFESSKQTDPENESNANL